MQIRAEAGRALVEVVAIHLAAASEAPESSSSESSCLNGCASGRTLTVPRGRGEMADALVSGTSGVKPVEVQVLSTAFM